ncbi:MAG: sensor domain-containing diguanylate cyclase [Oceanospirillaceae bacterium]|nr:sensor domain-containing diguanylate cyclase [Oceanospirillaceae bacterium]
MERSPADLMPRTRLTGNFVVWLLASLLFISCALMLEYRRLDSRADKVANDLNHHLEMQLASQGMVLESFAHYLSTLDPEPDLDLARAYAARLQQHEPNVYMLALASRVEPDARESFMQRMQDWKGRGFSIHPQREPGVRTAAPYYPVVLLEPELPEARALLGMDMSYETSALSGLLGRDGVDAGLSRPIALAENRGYLLYHAVEPGFEHGKNARLGGHRHYALLVVRAATLMPGWALDMPGLSVRLRHPDETLGDRGLLFEHPGESRSLLPLPTFTRTAALSDETQPLLLDIHYRPPWQVLDLWLIAGLFVGGVLLMSQGGWVLLRVGRARQRYMEQQQSLYEKAHYDHLTGLPNTNLLIDRLEQAIRSAQRTASRVAVFFLDLDDFKRVNDLWGHDVGDQLLIQVGVRLRESMRGEDTVARIHGDEFVILIPVLEGESQLDNVRDKLELLFTRPFRVGDIELTQGGSIGLAVYPDDADDAEGLLGLADRQMYLHKQTKGRDDISTAVGS